MKKRIVRECAILCGLALIPAVLSALFHPRRPSWRADALREGEVRLATVLSWKQPPVWADARSAKEYDLGHIPGALLLNEDEWEELLAPLLEAWTAPRPVVVYCGGQECQASRQVAGRLRESGVEPVYVLKGGWDAWRKAHP